MAITRISNHFGSAEYVGCKLKGMFDSVEYLCTTNGIQTPNTGHAFRVKGPGVPDADEEILIMGEDNWSHWVRTIDLEMHIRDLDSFIHERPLKAAGSD